MAKRKNHVLSRLMNIKNHVFGQASRAQSQSSQPVQPPEASIGSESGFLLYDSDNTTSNECVSPPSLTRSVELLKVEDENLLASPNFATKHQENGFFY